MSRQYILLSLRSNERSRGNAARPTFQSVPTDSFWDLFAFSEKEH